MYLKKLEIQGFKSFVDKLALDFGDGITAVVGPNGSGKSNISDAIRWVLGEQSAKSLRGGKMEDVIFVGTESRRPVGFAEVSLTIDNSDGILPIEFQEVKVTRRLFRSGESEYLINMSQCRLKDIQEIFFDTGIGVDGYSIIGQGQVDSILSGKVEERRAIFEEASGIMKYKIRKTEAERKLILTTQNIERITDIINELENQIEPLSVQSEIAKKYLALKEELKDYEISVYVDSISKISRQSSELADKYSQIKSEIEEQTQLLETVKISNEEKNTSYKTIEEELEKIRSVYYENEKQLSEHNADIKIIEGKISAIEENNRRLVSEIEESQRAESGLDEQLRIYAGDIKRLNAQQESENKKLKELEEKYTRVMELMSERTKNVEKLRAKAAEINKTHSETLSKVSAMNQIITGNNSRKYVVRKEIEALENEIIEIDTIKKAGTEAEEELSHRIEVLKVEREKYTIIKSKNEKRLEELKAEAASLSSEYQFKSSRLNLLSEMDERMEGYQKSVREVLSAASKEGFSKGIKGTLASLIDVEKKYEVAIETALGQAFQYVVTDSETTAKQAIEHLRKNNLGRATFLPMTAINGKTFEKNIINKLSKMSGYMGLGYEVINYDNQFHSVMLSQLGKVAIADNLDNAIEIAKAFGYNFKIITLKGDIIRPSGAITGGSIDKSVSSGILGRKREIDELTERTKELVRIIKEMNSEANSCNVKILNNVKELGKIDSDLRGLEIKLVEARSVAERLKERSGDIVIRKNALNTDLEIIDKESGETLLDIENANRTISELEDEINVLESEIEKSETENSTGRAAVDAMNNELTEKKLLVNSILHKAEAINENRRRLIESISLSKNDIESKRVEIIQNEKIINEMRLANREMETLINDFVKEQTGQNGLIEKMTLEKQTLGDQLLNMTNRIADISKRIYMLQEEYNRLEVRKTKLESEEENFRTKLWDDYEITYVNAQEYIKDKQLGSFTSMQKYINEIRGQIRELGDINVNAIEDYKNTKERLEFLKTQIEDLEISKVKLEKIIHDMSIIMKKQFIDHFELINQSFNSVFRELFDGGRANVIIADKNNVLESPIEIEVQPPGKKLQNMMLLSGGEKALTAIALLFAVLRLKPTPFCVLDEIEAALDDTNVIRFADYVVEFADNTQFVIITHRKGTMEAADIVYGVTMEERGVSKIVSMKFEK